MRTIGDLYRMFRRWGASPLRAAIGAVRMELVAWRLTRAYRREDGE